MPSSRRSSRSTNPLLQPSWHEKHKKYAPVSISLVFAEPEQGAPLASASQVIVSTQLDTVSVQSSDDTSILSQRLTCRQSLSSLDLQRPVEEVRQPHQQETSSASITLQYEEEPPSSISVDVPESTESLTKITSNNPVDLSSTHLPSFTPPAPSPTKQSWLERFRRIKGNKIPPRMSFVHSSSDPQSNTAIQLPHSNDMSAFVHVSDHNNNARSVSLLSTHSVADPTDDTDLSTSFTKSGNDTTQPLAFTSPSPRSLSSSKADYNGPLPKLIQESLPSSVDEDAPVVDLTHTLPPLPSSVVTTLDNESSSIDTLSVPSSRFTFFRRSVKQENAGVKSNDQPVSSLLIARSNHKKSSDRLAVSALVSDSSRSPQLLTVESQKVSEDAAQDFLQNAMSYSPPIMTAEEVEASPASNGSPGVDPIVSAELSVVHDCFDTPREEPTPTNSTIQSSSTGARLWSYFNVWSTTSTNPGSISSTKEKENGVDGPTSNMSGIGQSDPWCSGNPQIARRATMNQNLLSSSETIGNILCHGVDCDTPPATTHANFKSGDLAMTTSPNKTCAGQSHVDSIRTESTKSTGFSGNDDDPNVTEVENMISRTQEPNLSKKLEDSSAEEVFPQLGSSVGSTTIMVPSSSAVAASSVNRWFNSFLWFLPHAATSPSVAGDNEDGKGSDQYRNKEELGVGPADSLESNKSGKNTVPAGLENIREHQTNKQEEVFDGEDQAPDQIIAAWEQGEQEDRKPKGHMEGVHMTSNDAGVSNPIAQSITDTAYRSGWRSLFSSRRLVLRTLGYGDSTISDKDVKGDGHGVEVMEVDFDDEDNHNHSPDQISGNVQSDQDQKKNGRTGTKVVDGSDPMKSSRNGKKRSSSSSLSLQTTTSEDVKQRQFVADCVTSKMSVNAKKVQSRSISCSEVESGSTTPVVASAIHRPSATMGKIITHSPDPATGSPSTAPAVRAATLNKRTASPAPSAKKEKSLPSPNLVLPTWEDTFHAPPRNMIPPNPPNSLSRQGHGVAGGRLLGRAMGFVSGVLFSTSSENAVDNHDRNTDDDNKERVPNWVMKERLERFRHFGKELPHAWDTLEPSVSGVSKSSSRARIPPPSPPIKTSISSQSISSISRHIPWRFMAAMGRDKAPVQDIHETTSDHAGEQVHNVLRGCRRVVVIGIHGWFPGAVVRTVLGEPTGTSSKFVNMMVKALESFQNDHAVSLDKITRIPLEGEGTIDHRVDRLYSSLIANQEWMDDLQAADAIFVVAHSQGSVVSTHLLNRLIHGRHIRTAKNVPATDLGSSFSGEVGVQVPSTSNPQKICCLAMCGIHLGPLRYLRNSSLVQPYLHYFESNATRELFEFQNTESAVSKSYTTALRHVLDSGVKMVYVASMDDQVVPVYSGLFTAISHPLILRALYIDGDAYHSSDFLSNLLVLLIRILNSGISDSGLLEHLSEATAGSLNGVGHSTAYEELATYMLAVKYLFLTNDGLADHSRATLESFDATHEQNDYEIPWALRDVIANEHVLHLFTGEIAELRDAFRDWHPKTSVLRDLKRKLQPIQRLPSTFYSGNSMSKL